MEQNINVSPLKGKNILLVITGSVAAYKALELIRRLKEKDVFLDVILTRSAQKFITVLAARSLLGKPVYTDLFTTQQEDDVHHIRLARKADIILFAPLTASRMAKLAQGIADDLANTIFLASAAKIVFCPAMNPFMWHHPTTQRNKKQLEQDGGFFIGPEYGDMAEQNEQGLGRMSDVARIIKGLEKLIQEHPKSQKAPFEENYRQQLKQDTQTLKGKHFIVTAGPTQEMLDPIRYMTNKSSGKQGYAIAEALAFCGAHVTLISGPVTLDCPINVTLIKVHSAVEMLEAVEGALPADGAIFVAAVADWRYKHPYKEKFKKTADNQEITFAMVKNPDILKSIAHHKNRPALVIGFAAETENFQENAYRKLKEKAADAIFLNNVGFQKDGNGACFTVMEGDKNALTLISADKIEKWPMMSKKSAAKHIVLYCAQFFK